MSDQDVSKLQNGSLTSQDVYIHDKVGDFVLNKESRLIPTLI